MTASRLAFVLFLLALLASPGAVSAGPPRPATDPEIRAMIAAAGDAKAHGKAPFVVVLDEADVFVRDSGLAETRGCRVVKILTNAGARSHAVLREGFDPNTNRVAIDVVRIHRKDGAIEDVPVDGVITQPSTQGSIFWGGKQHLLSLPRLEIGDALEVRTRRIGFNIAYLNQDVARAVLSGEGLEPPMVGHWYEVARFSGRQPVLRKRYSVHMPKDKPLQFEVYGGAVRTSLWFDGDHHVYTFAADDIPAFKSEPSMASRDDCITKVVMATVADWPTKSRWFHGVNETQFEADDAIRAKVKEITEGLTDTDAKIAACLHWVSDNIRYYGTSRGPREGYTLHTGIETFHDRGGVCKDIAGMLITMLRVLGLEAYPSLTMAGPRVEDIPADQFNHTVCVLREEDGSFRVLDPTWSPISREWWSSREAEQGLVYGTPEGQGLTLSPFFPAENNAVQLLSDATLDTDGTLRTILTIDLKGYPCTYFRRNLNRHAPVRRQGALESVIGIAPNATIARIVNTDPKNYSTDSKAEMLVRAEGYAAGSGNVRLFKLPLMTHPLGKWTMSDLLKPPGGKDRKYPLRLRASRLVHYEETVTLPPGWTVTQKPKDRKVESGSVDLTFAATVDGSKLTYTFELRAKTHRLPAKDVAGLKKAIETMKEIAGEWVVCRVEEAK
jgi:Domain of Unknown Function with PDB structure (DUF3857)/Transglutaminase-like superfamily